MKTRSTTALLFAAIATALSNNLYADISTAWKTNVTGNWSNAADWTGGAVPNNGTPAGSLYDVTVSSGTITLDISPTIQQLLFSGGTITGSSPSQTLTAAGGIDFHGNASLSLVGLALNNPLSQTAVLGASGNASLHLAGSTFNNAGLFLASNTQGIFGTGTFNNSGNFTPNSTGTFTLDTQLNFNNTGTVYIQAGTLAYNCMNFQNITGAFNLVSGATLSLVGSETLTSAASVTGAGNVNCTAGFAVLTGTYNVTGNTTLSGGTLRLPTSGSTGPVTISGGTFQSTGTSNLSIAGLLTMSGGIFQAEANANAGIDFHGNGNVTLGSGSSLTNAANQTATLGASGNVSLTMQDSVFTNNGNFIVSNHSAIHFSGTNSFFFNFGNFTLDNGNTGTFSIDSGIFFRNLGLLRINSGTLAMNGNFTQQPTGKTLLAGGSLSSNSTLTFAAGTLAGTGAITAPVSLQSASTLAFTLGGETPGTGYDQLNVTGNVSLAGVINISFTNNFNTSILPTDIFTLLTVDPKDSLSGSLLNAANGARINTTDGLGSFLIHYSPTSHAITLDNFISSPTPEPTSLFLLTLGSLALFSRRRSSHQ